MITLADLPGIFEQAGFVRDGLARIGAILPHGRAVDPKLVEEATEQPTPANVCARLFYMAREVSIDLARSALTPAMFDCLVAEGLLLVKGDHVHAAFAAVPIGPRVILRDFEGWATGLPIGNDYVLGVGVATLMLSDLTVRRSGERVLDIGTGQGYQAIAAAGHASSVVGTDINVRALKLASLSLRINSVKNVELREGSFFEPVAAEKGTFDLLVSNPPFVIAPPHDITAIGGRWTGDSFVENLIRQAPEYLKEGGWATVLCNWHHPTIDDWKTRIGSWVQGLGVDAWIVRLKSDPARTYASSWLREAGSAEGERGMHEALKQLDSWLAYYKSLDVGAVSLGVVYLRKRAAGTVPNWARFDSVSVDECNESASDQAQRVFAAETLVRGFASPLDVMSLPLGLAPDGQLTQQWKVHRTLLRQAAGFEMRVGLDELPRQVLERLDGQRPCGQIIGEMAAAVGADPARAYAATAPFLVKMLRDGHVVVA
ncbi:MAG: methyltransferase [Planctomycetota bacterium]|nr:methyltransferase [Planctomycetota bacterium]